MQTAFKLIDNEHNIIRINEQHIEQVKQTTSTVGFILKIKFKERLAMIHPYCGYFRLGIRAAFYVEEARIRTHSHTVMPFGWVIHFLGNTIHNPIIYFRVQLAFLQCLHV